MASPMQVERVEESAVARNTAEAEEAPKVGEVEGAKLDPIRVGEAPLTRPDGTTVVVEVPVYPPFRLAERASGRKPPRAAARRRRSSASARARPGREDPAKSD